MSQRLPRLTSKEFGKVLERAGWELDRTSGSHLIYVRPGSALTLSVPRHKRAMSIGTLGRLLRDAGIGRNELDRLR